MEAKKPLLKSLFHPTVIVAALGYFVDIYDLSLFSIVRVPSLKTLGVEGADLKNYGVLLINMQMMGMLIGGLIWGIIGDKKGRLSVLFGSIIMYSLANIMNGFVQTIPQYAVLRIIAGIGLAGELGAGITLVTEILPKEIRGYGTMIVATVGASGAILAHHIAETYQWQTCYFIGGGLGLMLLLLRIGVFESGMFEKVKESDIKRGDFFMLFRKKATFKKYLHSIIIGIPVWYSIGILITFSPELAKQIGVTPEITSAGRSVMNAYLGLVVGDFMSGFISQQVKSRKKVIASFILLLIPTVIYYLYSGAMSANTFYLLCFLIGVFSGFWVLFCTVAAEQFGTNIRSTAATTIPNFVRGSVVPLTLLFQLFEPFGVLNSAALVGLIAISISLYSLTRIKETFGEEMNFLEH